MKTYLPSQHGILVWLPIPIEIRPEGSLPKAAKLVSGKLIFNDTAPENAPYQRVAATSIPDGFEDQSVYVLRSNDGMTMTVTSGQRDDLE
jgi:hypothetical protein